MQGIAAQFASGDYGPFRGAAAIVGSADIAKYGAAVEPLLVELKKIPNFRGIRVSGSYDAELADSKGNFAGPGLYTEARFALMQGGAALCTGVSRHI